MALSVEDIKAKVLGCLEDMNPILIGRDNFIEEGLLDSLDIMNLIVSLEECFEIEVEVTDIVAENFNNTNNIERLVTKYIKHTEG
jgi:acyl carrier protein